MLFFLADDRGRISVPQTITRSSVIIFNRVSNRFSNRTFNRTPSQIGSFQIIRWFENNKHCLMNTIKQTPAVLQPVSWPSAAASSGRMNVSHPAISRLPRRLKVRQIGKKCSFGFFDDSHCRNHDYNQPPIQPESGRRRSSPAASSRRRTLLEILLERLLRPEKRIRCEDLALHVSRSWSASKCPEIQIKRNQ